MEWVVFLSDFWIVLGYANRPDLTERTIEQLMSVTREFNLIVIDNGCHEPISIKWAEIKEPPKNLKRFIAIHNDKNVGCLPMLVQSLKYIGDDDIVVFMHNDVLIWDEDWDDYVRSVFAGMPTLGLAGFFGAPGVALDGGRMFAKSHMVGKEWGTEGYLHGTIMPHFDVAPATVIDSLAMIFRASALKKVGIPEEWPPHHWFDRLFCLRFIEQGWRVAVLGVAFDHYGGGSSGKTMDSFAQEWVKETMGEDLDIIEANNRLYMKGLQIYQRDYGDRLSLIADGWDYIWRTGRQAPIEAD
jgi:GT2 family glycosyltransferase